MVDIYIPLWIERAFVRSNARSYEAARPIAMAHVQSYDHLITRAILSHYLATLAFIVQQSHINARPIARFNAFTSQNGRFRSCDRCATTFSFAIISATVYDPNLNFSIARLFGRFWSCANCERAFSKSDTMTAIPIGPNNTNLTEDVEILLSAKFRWILYSSFKREVENVSAN